MFSHNTDGSAVKGIIIVVKKGKFIVGRELVNCMHFQTFGLQIVTNYIKSRDVYYTLVFTTYIKRSHHDKLCISTRAFLIHNFLTNFIFDTGISHAISLVHRTFHCPSSRQVMVSIHDEVTGIFH